MLSLANILSFKDLTLAAFTSVLLRFYTKELLRALSLIENVELREFRSSVSVAISFVSAVKELFKELISVLSSSKLVVSFFYSD